MYRSDSLFSAPASSILASPLQRSRKTLDQMSAFASKSGHERRAKLRQRRARRDFPRGEELRGLLEIIPQAVGLPVVGSLQKYGDNHVGAHFAHRVHRDGGGQKAVH